jgi:peptidoglycan-N-acetylglucosamine deacetylase
MRLSTVALVTSSAVVGGVSAVATYGSVSKSSQLFGPSVFRGPGKRRSLALTFDDGPSEGTMRLLEYLDREGIRATFFLCGLNVQRHPAIAGEVAGAGHQIGNHTYSHPRLPFKTRQVIEHEFTQAQEVIVSETGVAPMVLRPPYGLRWSGMKVVQQKLSLLNVLWTVIANDWKWRATRIAERVLGYSSPGGIICLHDGRGVHPAPDISQTVAAVRQIVPVLKDQGYEFETVSDLLNY